MLPHIFSGGNNKLINNATAAGAMFAVAGSGAGNADEQPEAAYAKLAPSEHRRRFGQFFTPMKVARAMAEWVMERNPATLLDPALGMGVFVLTGAVVALGHTAQRGAAARAAGSHLAGGGTAQ